MFADEDDTFLYKYLAKYNPAKPGRSGNLVYKTLVENVSPSHDIIGTAEPGL